MIKKADIALFFVILISGLVLSFVTLTMNTDGDKVIVTVDGKDYGIYSLFENQTIEVKQKTCTNYITIKDGKVSMESSTCKNQVCVNTGAISQTKDSIVCLPNKVMVEIRSKGGSVDVITG